MPPTGRARNRLRSPPGSCSPCRGTSRAGKTTTLETVEGLEAAQDGSGSGWDVPRPRGGAPADRSTRTAVSPPTSPCWKPPVEVAQTRKGTSYRAGGDPAGTARPRVPLSGGNDGGWSSPWPSSGSRNCCSSTGHHRPDPVPPSHGEVVRELLAATPRLRPRTTWKKRKAWRTGWRHARTDRRPGTLTCCSANGLKISFTPDAEPQLPPLSGTVSVYSRQVTVRRGGGT